MVYLSIAPIQIVWQIRIIMKFNNLRRIFLRLTARRHTMTEGNRSFAICIRTQADDRTICPISTGHAAHCQSPRTFRMGIGTDGNATVITVGNRIARYSICIKRSSPKAISPFRASFSTGGIDCNLYTCR